MFPVYILRTRKDVDALPTSGTYYILARNGFFIHRDSGLIRGTVKVDQMSFLEPIEPWAEFLVPPIPEAITRQAVAFFRTVYRKMQTETTLLLHYNQDENSFCLSCPEQDVSPASVDYDAGDRIKDFLLVGSLHSHCGFGAFHSGGDHRDEETFDGIHVTIGNNDSDRFSVVASLVINGNRFPLSPEVVLTGIRLVPKGKPRPVEVKDDLAPPSPLIAMPEPDEEPQKGFLSRVVDALAVPDILGLGNIGAPGFFTSFDSLDAPYPPRASGKKYGGYDSKPKYELTTPLLQDEEASFFPKSWMSRLHRFRFTSGTMSKEPVITVAVENAPADTEDARTWEQGGDS